MLPNEMQFISHFLQTNPVFTCFLLAHFLSDFQLQSQKTADRKQSNGHYLVRHIGVVGSTLVPVIFLIPKAFLLAIVILITHAIIDWGTIYFSKHSQIERRIIFVIDQVLHVGIMTVGYLLLKQHTFSGASQFDTWAAPLRFLLFIVLITKPANIFFKVWFTKYQPNKESSLQASVTGAGALIGVLERLTMALCIWFGQFASIGLVFTAKSIARYNKISEDPLFAEYYLIGSLYSILSVMIAYGICLA